MPKLIARWNPARDVWETETTGLFCEHSDVFSATWPSSGTTRAGVAYEQPTSVPLTDGSASSSLLQTPSVSDATGGHLTRGGERSGELLLPGQVRSLLPTPRTSDTNGAGQHGDGGMDLRTVVDLLPTPRATDGTKGGPNQRGSSGDLMLPSAVQLLPTPTATPYGSNQSDSPNAAVRPSLDTLAVTLLPTPTTTQRGPDANLETREGARANLHNIIEAVSLGASTNPRFAAGSTSSAGQPPHLPSPDLEADSA